MAYDAGCAGGGFTAAGLGGRGTRSAGAGSVEQLWRGRRVAGILLNPSESEEDRMARCARNLKM